MGLAIDTPDSSQPQKEKPDPRRVFLEILGATRNVKAAAQAAGIDRTTAYVWRKDDPEFGKAWDEAVAHYFDSLETEGLRRAYTKSDRLMEFFLKANSPEKYRETVRQEHTSPDGKPQRVEIVYRISERDPSERPAED